MPPFHLTEQDLRLLNDADLRELVRRLCTADMAQRGLPVSAVRAGGAQEAADGGLDVVVHLTEPLKSPDFVPRAYTGFQVKKYSMTPAACRKEMQCGQRPKAVTAEIAAEGGAYIMVTADSCSDLMLKKRLASMKEAVQTLPDRDRLWLDFYGLDRLLQWLERHPGVELWARDRIGRPLFGWRSYGRWTNVAATDDDRYLTDEQAHLTDTTGGRPQQLTLAEGLAHFRQLLKAPQAVLRLTGLSGTGKTRFAQALFEESIDAEALPQAEAVYADLGENPCPAPGEMIERLIAENRPAIVIVDNCDRDNHRLLAKKIHSTAPHAVRLLTIEYDVREDLPNETQVFLLTTAAPSLAAALLQQRFPSLSPEDALRLDKLSDGNARLAIALASQVKHAGSLAQFRDEDLFDRLFWQRNTEAPQLLRHAQVLSLVYSVRISDEANDDELQALADLAGASRSDLLASTAILKERHLMQSRSLWHAVLPQALANRLAVLALQSLSLKTLYETLAAPKNARLLRSHAHRLGLLPPDVIAVTAAIKLMQATGLHKRLLANDPEALTLLEYLAPAAEEEALALLEKLLANPDFHPTDARRIACLLWHLAYEAPRFGKAVRLLLKLIARQPQDPNAANGLSTLFSLFLSGTMAAPDQRLKVLADLVENAPSETCDAQLPALFASALKTRHWSLAGDCSFGSLPRSAGWEPAAEELASESDPVKHWYRSLLELLASEALAARPSFTGVQDAFFTEFSTLWQQGIFCNELEKLCRQYARTEAGRLWVIRALNGALTACRLIDSTEDASPALTARLAALRQDLLRTDLVFSVRLLLSGAYFDEADDIDSRGRQLSETSQRLGRAVGYFFPHLLPAIESQLWENRPPHAAFGQGLAQAGLPYDEVLHLLIKSYEKLNPATEPDVLIGFLAETECQSPSEAQPLIEACLRHESLRPFAVQLLFTHQLAPWKVDPLLKLADDRKIPLQQFFWLSLGQRHASLADDVFVQLLLKLSARPQGWGVVVDLLHMRLFQETAGGYTASSAVLHCADDVLRHLLTEAPSHQLHSKLSADLHFMAKRVLPSLSKEKQALQLEALCTALNRPGTLVSDCSPFLQAWLETSPAPLLDAFLNHSADPGFITRLAQYFNSNSCHYSVNRVPWEIVAAWCDQNENRLRLMIRLTTVVVCADQCEMSRTSPGLHLSDRVLALLDRAPDKKAMTELIIRLAKNPCLGWMPRSDLQEIHRKACVALLYHPSSDVRRAAAPLIAEMDEDLARLRAEEARQTQENAAFE